jgi:hypothetical protein
MYEARYSVQFQRAIRREPREEMRNACEEILADPYNARGSHPLSHDWAGFRGAEFSRTGRIIFRICEECVQKHQESLSPLDCCARPELPRQIVNFVDFGNYHASAGRRRLRPARSYDLDDVPGDQDEKPGRGE